jgi:tRNA(Ile)-lysidine synthetase-like protein
LSKNLFVDSSLIESIDRVISSKRPNIIFKEKGMIIEKSYNDLKIEREAGDDFDREDFLQPGMETLFNGYTLKITKTVFIESLLKKKNVFVFPLSAGRRFKIRTLQTSDSFVPFGMNKEKKVSRFLMDNKISLSERRRVPLILNEKDEILAVGSLRRTGLYRMKKQKGCLCIYVGKN